MCNMQSATYMPRLAAVCCPPGYTVGSNIFTPDNDPVLYVDCFQLLNLFG